MGLTCLQMLLQQTIVTLDAETVATAFVSSCLALGVRPTTPLIAMLCGQSAMETGHWRALVCFNFGNVKADDGWIAAGNHYVFYDGDEVKVSENMSQAQLNRASRHLAPAANGSGNNMRVALDRGEESTARFAVYFKGNHPQARFRGFRSPEGGAMGFLTEMIEVYQDALDAAAKGDVDGYVAELARIVPAEGRWGYFTAPVDRYTVAVMRNYKLYMSVAEHAVSVIQSIDGMREPIEIGLCPEIDDILSENGTRLDPV